MKVRLLGNASVSFDTEKRNATISFLNGSRTLWREMRLSTANASLELEDGLNKVSVKNEDGEVVFERVP